MARVRMSADARFGRWAIAVAVCLVGMFFSSSGLAGPLTPAERAWLKHNEPLIFISQTTYPPFEFLDTDGQRQGMCLDLARWMARELGFAAEFRDASFEDAQEAVLQGEADVLTSLFYSEERDRRYDFSTMTWEVPTLLFVRAERPDIVDLKDLQGKRIALQRGDYAADFLRDKGVAYRPVPTASFAEATARVIDGEADALVGDQPIVLHYLYSHNLTRQLKSVGTPLYVGRNGMAVREGRDVLQSILNKGLELARQRGVLDAISTKWMGTQYSRSSDARSDRQMGMTAALLIAVLLAAMLLLWIVHLRRVVARRTAELQEARDLRRSIVPDRPWRTFAGRSLLLVLILFPLALGANHVLVRFVVMPDFLALEHEQAQKRITVAMDAVSREAELLGRQAVDWAHWDEAYAFVRERDAHFIENNLRFPDLSSQAQIDMVLFFDAGENLVWQGIRNPFTQDAETLASLFGGPDVPTGLPFRHPDRLRARTGMVRTARGPLLVASALLLPGDTFGPARGVLVLGRFLRPEILDGLGQTLDVDFALATLDHLRPEQGAVLARLTPGSHLFEEVSSDTLRGHALLADVHGQGAFLLTMSMPREIVRQGRETSRLLSFVLFESALLIFLGTTLWLALSFRESSRRQAHVEALVQARTAALKQSERNFRALYDSMTDIVAVMDLDGRVLHTNRAARDALGYARDELTGMRVLEWYPEDTYRDAAHLFSGEARPGEALPFHSLETGDGRRLVVEQRFWPGHWGGAECMFGMFKNLTPEQEARLVLQSAFLCNPTPMLLTTYPERRVAEVNDAFLSLTGYTRQEFVGRRVEDVGLLFDSGQYEAVFGRLPMDGGFRDREVRIRGKNGEERVGLLSGAMMVNQGRKDVLTVFVDLTERQRAEEALRRSEERNRALLQALPDMMFLYDHTGIFLDYHAADPGTLVVPPEKFLGRSITEVLPDLAPSVMASIAEVLRTGATPPMVYELPGNGEPLFFESRMVACSPTTVLGIVRDITNQRKVENALKEAKEAAEAASQAKSEFLANMSHEIRTPINGVMSMLTLLQGSALNAEQAGYASTAVQACSRLLRLLTDILDLSRIEAGKLTLQPSAMQVAEVMGQTRDLFLPLAQKSGVALDFQVDERIPLMVVGDAVRLQQVLTNIVGNALKFTASGRVSVSADVLPIAPEGQCRVLFSVVDTGMGIPDDKLAMLFRPFSQVNEGYRRLHQGAGLGLSICKRLVAQMGGTLAVESEEGQGSAFYFTVLFGRSAATRPERQPVEEGAMEDLKGVRVLLAEDDQVSGMAAAMLLRKKGAVVEHVGDGAQVLDVLLRERFDVVLMDVQMPIMDGLEATGAIRSGQAGEINRNIPIIVLTAYAMDGDEQKFLRAGMSGYVSKPVGLAALLRAIGLGMRSARSQTAAS